MGRRYLCKRAITPTPSTLISNDMEIQNTDASINMSDNNTAQQFTLTPITQEEAEFLTRGQINSNISVSEEIETSPLNVVINEENELPFVLTPHKKRVILLNSDMHLDSALKINKDCDPKQDNALAKAESKNNEISAQPLRQEVVMELNEYLNLSKSNVKSTNAVMKKTSSLNKYLNLNGNRIKLTKLTAIPVQNTQEKSLLKVKNQEDNETYMLVPEKEINISGSLQEEESEKSLLTADNPRKLENSDSKSVKSVMRSYLPIKPKPPNQTFQSNQVKNVTKPFKLNQMVNVQPHNDIMQHIKPHKSPNRTVQPNQFPFGHFVTRPSKLSQMVDLQPHPDVVPQTRPIILKKVKRLGKNNSESLFLKVKPQKETATCGNRVMTKEPLALDLDSGIDSDTIRVLAMISKNEQEVKNSMSNITSFNKGSVNCEQSDVMEQQMHNVFPVGALQTVDSDDVRLFTNVPEEEECEILGF